MKWEIFLSVLMAVILIVINVFLYLFVIDIYRIEHIEALHEIPTFRGFFLGRPPYWYLVINAPLITAILLLIRVVNRWRKFQQRQLISG